MATIPNVSPNSSGIVTITVSLPDTAVSAQINALVIQEYLPTTNYTLTLTQASNGTITNSPTGTSFASGTVVTLNASPNSGYTFSGWTGALSGTTNPATLTMIGNETVSATFTQSPVNYTLTVTAPSNGIITNSPTGTSFASGTVVTLNATPNSGYTFSGWTGALSGTTNPATLTMTGNETVSATFTQSPVNYTLTVTAPSNGIITNSPTGTSFASGTVVTLNATPNSGYTFSGWTGALSGTTNPVTLTMTGNETVSATFTPTTTNYTLTITPPTGGTITTNQPSNIIAAGTNVQLIATPTSGYVFTGWGGALNGISSPTTLTMSNNYTVSATFTLIPVNYTLTITPPTNGQITTLPTGNTFQNGDLVYLNATPANGYYFSGWGGTLSGSNNPYTLTMNSNNTVSATFTQVPSSYNNTITITQPSHGTITTNPSGTSFAPGTTITFTATPSSGYYFTGWGGALVGTSNPMVLTIPNNTTNYNYNISATFSQTNVTNYTLTVTQPTNGNILILPVSGPYLQVPSISTFASGTILNLALQSGEFSSGGSWGGALSGTTSPTTLTMNGNKTVSANFPPSTCSLKINTIGNGCVTTNPSGDVFTYGTTVTLTATPAGGSNFTGWGGALSGTNNQTTITIQSNDSVSASFTNSGSQWITNNSGIYYNSGNVGIGTHTPTDNLSVWSGNSSQKTGIGIGRANSDDGILGVSGVAKDYSDFANQGDITLRSNAGGLNLVGGNNDINFTLGTTGSMYNGMTILGGGAPLGHIWSYIGPIGPNFNNYSTFSVNDYGMPSISIINTATKDQLLISTSSVNSTLNVNGSPIYLASDIVYNGYNAGNLDFLLGSNSNNGKTYIEFGDNYNNGWFKIYNNATATIIGKVGIGITSTPTQALQVNGNIQALPGGYFIGNGSQLTGIGLWTPNSTGIYYNSGNVAIGTTTTSGNALTVNGSVSTGSLTTTGTITAPSLTNKWWNLIFFINNWWNYRNNTINWFRSNLWWLNIWNISYTHRCNFRNIINSKYRTNFGRRNFSYIINNNR